jgi:hypothetical protein
LRLYSIIPILEGIKILSWLEIYNYNSLMTFEPWIKGPELPEEWTLNGQIVREQVEMVFEFYRAWDAKCWYLMEQEFSPIGALGVGAENMELKWKETEKEVSKDLEQSVQQRKEEFERIRQFNYGEFKPSLRVTRPALSPTSPFRQVLVTESKNIVLTEVTQGRGEEGELKNLVRSTDVDHLKEEELSEVMMTDLQGGKRRRRMKYGENLRKSIPQKFTTLGGDVS